MKITVLFENHAGFKKGLFGAHGFSVLVEHKGKNILVDAGSDGKVLLHNIKALNISPEEVDVIFLTHGHYDHTGGLEEFLKARKSSIDIYAHPDVFLRRIALKPKRREIGIPFSQEHLEKIGANFILKEKPVRIFDEIYTSGEIERRTWDRAVGYIISGKKLVKDPLRDDMALFIELGDKIAVISGCGHSGILNIVEHSWKVMNKPIFALIGGFHLSGAKKNILEDAVRGIRTFGVEKLYPGHCTGFDGICAFMNVFGDKVEPLYAGKEVKFVQ
ncbi:MBL fold metallo-hydrolase [Thermococcus sp.]|uniref:MBL fold metallo-hydrolase n=1 Tax=Thermococcus sp. TaxID=35749 RepID=UPI0019ADDD54|nr:MBL fold metallo-hydrolase [Thermococcus sp.]MBC7094316.1 MBL fold metallo-hydrolase [Thermococcus sp.]